MGRVRAARAARWLRRALGLVMVLGVVVLAYVWLAGTAPRHLGVVGVYVQPPAALAGHPLLARTGVSVALLIWLYGLWRLHRLMRCFETGDFFGRLPIAHLRAFALTLLVAALADLLLPPLLQLAAALVGRVPVHRLQLQLDGSDVGLVLVAGLFYLIAWILAEAREAVEDSAQIV